MGLGEPCARLYHAPPTSPILRSQDARLNYLEQHASRLGGDEAAGALEGARLAAARSSPLSDALDLLARCVCSIVCARCGCVLLLHAAPGSTRYRQHVDSTAHDLTLSNAADPHSPRCVSADPTGAAALKLVPELTGLVRRGEAPPVARGFSCLHTLHARVQAAAAAACRVLHAAPAATAGSRLQSTL